MRAKKRLLRYPNFWRDVSADFSTGGMRPPRPRFRRPCYDIPCFRFVELSSGILQSLSHLHLLSQCILVHNPHFTYVHVFRLTKKSFRLITKKKPCFVYYSLPSSWYMKQVAFVLFYLFHGEWNCFFNIRGRSNCNDHIHPNL